MTEPETKPTHHKPVTFFEVWGALRGISAMPEAVRAWMAESPVHKAFVESHHHWNGCYAPDIRAVELIVMAVNEWIRVNDPNGRSSWLNRVIKGEYPFVETRLTASPSVLRAEPPAPAEQPPDPQPIKFREFT